ncbi:hypothetical protein PInf_026067 [Phytophthora infestans]|nr:hypothetical protein PInf_026067 [Phytophthora infestans]
MEHDTEDLTLLAYMEQEEQQATASIVPSQNGGHQPGRLEERLDEMQTEIRATRQMMRELSMLVHRQLQKQEPQRKCVSFQHRSTG